MSIPADPKTLDNVNGAAAVAADPGIKFFGNPDLWQLVCKASSEAQGWMKSTKRMDLPGVGAIYQVSTQQRNQDGSYVVAEAVCFVPEAK